MRSAPTIFPSVKRVYAGNGVLAACTSDEWDRIRPRLELVEIAAGSIVHEPGVPLTKIYFPLTGLISQMNIMEDGACGETAVVGNEGVEGVAWFMGGEPRSSWWSVAQGSVTALRLPARAAKEEFLRGGAFQRQVLKYIRALMMQMGQVVVCNRHHTVKQRLCRWLLLSHDRIASDQLAMTQEGMANMLGVRREGVTCAARALQEAGLIRYTRGHITVLDREGLEESACECYHVISQEYRGLSGSCKSFGKYS